MRYHIINASVVTAVLIAITLSVFALKGIYPFGDRVNAWGDMTAQGLPYLYNQWDLFHNFSVASVDWHILGGVPSWNLPLLLAPFNLPILLTDRQNIFQFFSILILFKMICMALTMYAFTNRFNVQRQYKILVAVLYGSSSCVLIHYHIEYVMFDCAILFPILMLGFYRLLEQQKPLLYIVMLTLVVSKSFYVGAMVCMFMFFASLAYFYSIDREEFLSKSRLLTLSTVAALSLSALFCMPSLVSMFASDRLSSGSQIGLLKYYLNAVNKYHIFNWDYVFQQLVWAINFVCFSALPLAVTIMSRRRLSLYYKLLFIIIVLASFIPGSELLMHGGSRQEWPIRFGFVVNFVMLEIMLASIELKPSILDEPQSKKFALPIATAIAIVVLAAIGADKYGSTQVTLLTVESVVCFFWLMLYIVSIWRPTRWFIFAAMVVLEIAIMQYPWFAPKFDGYAYSKHQSTTHWNIKEFNQYFFTAAELDRELDHSKIDRMTRARDFDGAFGNNYAFVTETNSIGAFYGGMSKPAKAVYSALGHTRTGGQYVADNGGTVFSDALINVRSVFTLDKDLGNDLYVENTDIKAVRWFDHRFKLPVGLTVDRDVDIIDNAFAFQNAIFKSITARDDRLITQYPIEVETIEHHLDIASHPRGPVEGKLILNIEGHRVIYFYGDKQDNPAEGEDRRHFTVKLNGADMFIPNLTEPENRIYPVDYNGYLIDLGTFNDETIELTFETVDDYDFNDGIHVGGLDIELMSDAFDELNRESSVAITSFGDDSVSMKVNAPDDETIFLPIPFDNGWHCMVNGADVRTKKIFGGFIGFEVPKGMNDVQLKFSMPGS